MTSRTLGHRAPLLWLVAPLMGGLAIGKLGDFAPVPWLLGGAFIAALAANFAAWRAPRWSTPGIAVAMLLAGAASYPLHRARLAAWDNLPPREVRVAVRVDRVFPSADEKRASGLATIVRASDPVRELAGQHIYFSLTLRRNEAAPVRSAIIVVNGVLAPLARNPPADSFDGYLANAGMNFRLARGRVLTIEKPPLAYYAFCARAAARFKEILSVGIARKRPELAGLLRAMMLGETQELSDEQHTLFMRSGTMHLFAISGLNIAVIAGALQAILGLLRVPQWGRFAIGTALLWLFVDITGASASAVRAFAMAVFFHAAFVGERPGNPLAALVASALAVLLAAPLQMFGASFLMSYAIVAALLVLGLPLGEAWQTRWTPWRDLPEVTWRWWQHAGAATWRWTATVGAIGIATTLVSMITGVQFFHLLTPGALVANLALIPAAMLVTLAGFAALLCGLAGWIGGASFCNHSAALMLLVIEWVVRIGVQVKGAFVPAAFTAPWVGSVALVVLMATLLAGYATGWRKERGSWWPPFAIVALVMIFGVKFG